MHLKLNFCQVGMIILQTTLMNLKKLEYTAQFFSYDYLFCFGQILDQIYIKSNFNLLWTWKLEFHFPPDYVSFEQVRVFLSASSKKMLSTVVTVLVE